MLKIWIFSNMKRLIFSLIFLFTFLPSIAEEMTPTELSAKFISLLIEKKFDEAVQNFDSLMVQQFNAEQLRQLWTQLSMQIGTVDSVDNSYMGITAKGIIEIITPLHFKSMSLDAKVYVQSGKISGFFLAPHTPRDYLVPSYADTTKFKEIEIVVGKDLKYPLPGKLTMPINAENVPCLILVHGSGPNDMDETIGPNKVFKDIAFGLSSAGIAVLRYDKITKAYPEEMGKLVDSLTLWEETIADAISAYELAKTIDGIDANRISIMGHSLGAYAIPLIAKHTNAHSYIMAASPARPFEDVIKSQYNYIFNIDSILTEDEKKYLDDFMVKYRNIKNLRAGVEVDSSEFPLNMSKHYWDYILNYDLIGDAINISSPLLVIHNERDYQVTHDDFKILKESLKKDNIKLVELQRLNHIFHEGNTPSRPDEYNMRASVSPKLINLLTEWLNSKD